MLKPARAIDEAAGLSTTTTLLLAAACGALAANLYYAQPLIAIIGPSVGLRPELYSLVVTLTQLGYVLGLVFVVPLGDMLESRRSISALVLCTAAAVLGAALAPNAWAFLLASLMIGIFASGLQMLVPLAAHLSPEAARGRTVGNVMSGLIMGVLLARPIASLASDHLGWRTFFIVAAIATAMLAALMLRALPSRRPRDPPRYGALIASLWHVLRRNPVLRRRMLYQAPLFGAFSLFWTAVPLELAGPSFRLTQTGIAAFALAGAAGALSAPFAGRAADRGHTFAGTGLAIVMVIASFGFCWLGGRGSLAALVAAAIVLDAGVQGSQLFGQRAIYSLAPEIRSRLNGLFIAASFVGGACGSAVASTIFIHGGWSGIAALGAGAGGLSFLAWLTELRIRP